MTLKTIFYKDVFITAIILIIIYILGIGTNTINMVIEISIIPVFLLNILIILDNINNTIINMAEERKEYFKKIENDFSISKTDREDKINSEIIYDKIQRFCDIKVKRILSTLCVIVFVTIILYILFKEEIYIILQGYNFNVITICSIAFLIIDTHYKEKIAKKVLEKTYKYKNKL